MLKANKKKVKRKDWQGHLKRLTKTKAKTAKRIREAVEKLREGLENLKRFT